MDKTVPLLPMKVPVIPIQVHKHSSALYLLSCFNTTYSETLSKQSKHLLHTLQGKGVIHPPHPHKMYFCTVTTKPYKLTSVTATNGSKQLLRLLQSGCYMRRCNAWLRKPVIRIMVGVLCRHATRCLPSTTWHSAGCLRQVNSKADASVLFLPDR